MKRWMGAGGVCAFAVAVSVLGAHGAKSQTTGGVFGPVVKEGARSFQLRSAWSFDEASSNRERRAHRLHVQQGFTDRLRGRFVVQGREANDGDFDLQYLQAEGLFELTGEDTQCWRSAIRFDARYVDPDFGADRLRLNWTNQCDFGDGWRVRALAQSIHEIGDQRRGGVGLEARGSLTRSGAFGGQRLGVEFFSGFGRTGDIGGFDEQNHRIGPVMSGGRDAWRYQISVLGGVSDAARDADLRIWLGRSF